MKHKFYIYCWLHFSDNDSAQVLDSGLSAVTHDL